ncbi:MAG: helix-turn-helix transcriptional regulator [Clostridiales bacterium]|nr:helix-turn-helix transcriptional regulator [Clostridiales bacterium]
MSYIDVLKDIMQENNLSQEKMAKILGVNQTTISQWLLGNKKPNFDSIYTIYKKFNITPNELFGIDN